MRNIFERIVEKIGVTGAFIVSFLVFLIIIVASWFIRREFNYSIMYEEKVMETAKQAVEPLEERINKLELKIKMLEKNMER